ncbi:tyrosinase-like protein [Cladorrhinum samala]|uniref:Tyrosinase-like protein n=1 Tax=Cladorrhinum samala TaxID=585594 RepID=A0AAV9I5B0_9PEZI|nr:tyrosinase-like protein [Cladorrhinum samala]
MEEGATGFRAKTSASTGNADGTHAVPKPAASQSCTQNVRVEWNNMADADKLSYVQSVKCLMNAAPLGVWANATSIWDEITWVHDQLSERIHGVDTFLPWHRYYLHMLKTLLRQQCSYAGPMPWWRETDYTGNFAGSGLFTPEYFGSLPPLSDTAEGTCITDGAFANTTILVGPDGPTCLSRGETKQTTDETTIATLNLCHGDLNTEYSQHRRCVEQTIHATMHEGLGPTMWLLATSPGDPVFFMHHGFVDWQWKRWQDANPGVRSTSISGCAEYPGDGSPCVPLTRDTVLTTMGLVPDMTVGDVLDTENDVMCYTYDEF